MLKVKLTRSIIGCNPTQRRTVEALGFNYREQVRTLPDNPAVRGMLKRIEHMVEVQENVA